LRWGGAFALAALAAGAIVYLVDGDEHEVEATPRRAGPAEAGCELGGWLDAPGIDPDRCEARCTPMRIEDAASALRSAALDADGRFVLTDLADTDYCLEIVVRSNPALVVARKDHVRPACGEVLLESSPSFLFGTSDGTRATE
jgi:hypothetical protein